MLNNIQINRTLDKQWKFVERLEPLLFDIIDEVTVKGYETFEKLNLSPNDESLFKPMKAGDTWGAEKGYCWFKTSYTVPKKYAGKKLYIQPNCNSYESLLFVNGIPYTNFASKIHNSFNGNHYCKIFVQNPKAFEVYHLDFEAYAGNDIEGLMPFDAPIRRNYKNTLGTFKIAVKNDFISNFYYDYKTLRELYEALPDSSFKKSEIQATFLKMNEFLYYSREDIDDESFINAIQKAALLMKPVLKKKNSETVASIGILGHSHMDTAWLWEIDETIKKCARTFSNQLSLMEQYPNYHFMQSSVAHLKMIELNYPILFERIKEKILEGRYEPNGGVWIECDCNITGGEFLIRHFLWGQNYLMEKFGYQSNAFFLPDTFGYSAAIPQILKSCGISYFLTTKMDWNDTNKFPYETYHWQGIDGTKVFAHHNITHCWPSPATATKIINELSQKSVSNERLMTFGFGDGGGGPEEIGRAHV